MSLSAPCRARGQYLPEPDCLGRNSPGEDKCFIVSVSNWLKGTITFIFATESLDSAKYIYTPWQKLDFNFLEKHTQTSLLQYLVKDPIL